MPTYRLKKDLVIPAGTRFSTAPAKTERNGAGHVEAVFGLSPNTYGTVYYSLDSSGKDDLGEWFEELPVDDHADAVFDAFNDGRTTPLGSGLGDVITEAIKIVEAAKQNPNTIRAFGREFDAEGLLAFSLDFAALSRIAGDYAGEPADEWARKFGMSRAVVAEAIARCVGRRNGGV